MESLFRSHEAPGADSSSISYAAARYVAANQWRIPVNAIQFGPHAGPSVSDSTQEGENRDARVYPTPSGAMAQIGRVIAVCLGLALPTQFLLAFVGPG
jgi:hypothetical protein